MPDRPTLFLSVDFSEFACILPYVKIPPHNDPIAVLLRDHFQTEESDAGLRSPSLEGAPKGSSSPDTAAVTRASSGRQDKHRRCRAALSLLDQSERTVLSLAYGMSIRSRDIDDHHGRKAPKKIDRNWRVLLRETFRDLGAAVGIVQASPLAIRSAKNGSVIEWLMTSEAKSQRQTIQDEAVALLIAARKSFALCYIPPANEEKLDAPKKRNRGRPKIDDDIRYRLLGGAHGREIGR